MLPRIVLAVVAACLLPSGALALTPVISGTRGAQVASAGPIGESFVADDARLSSFGFQFAVANDVPAAPLNFELRAGAGLTGALLASMVATPAIPTGRTPTWYDFALTGVTLTIGQSYTALVSTNSTRLALIFGPNLAFNGTPASSDAYLAGMLFSAKPVDTSAGTAGYCATNSTCDANFRVNALAAAVPEPATWVSMIFGFLAVCIAQRKGTITGGQQTNVATRTYAASI